MTTTDTGTSGIRLMPRPITLLMGWHGLFAGAYTIAFVTQEGPGRLHELAGYITVGLLALRLGVALLVGSKSLWALPWAPGSLWRGFARKLARDPMAALRGRTPFAPLTGAAVLATVTLAAASGLMTLPVHAFEDLHEGAASLTYPALILHLAVVALPVLLRKLGGEERTTARTPYQKVM